MPLRNGQKIQALPRPGLLKRPVSHPDKFFAAKLTKLSAIHVRKVAQRGFKRIADRLNGFGGTTMSRPQRFRDDRIDHAQLLQIFRRLFQRIRGFLGVISITPQN